MGFSPYGTEETPDLFKKLLIPNLTQLNKIAKAKFIFKHQKKKLPQSFDDYFRNVNEINNRNSRAPNNVDIYSSHGRTRFAQNLIQNEGAGVWNKIPDSIRNLESLERFANNYTNYLIAVA